MPRRSTETIGALETSLRILESMKEQDNAGVTDLSRRLDIPKSTVYSHLRTLRENGYVVNEDDEYRLGLKFLDYGERTRDRLRIYRVAKPELDALANETGELANLLVAEHGEGVYLLRRKGDRAVNLDTRTGTRVKLHCTALGKAVLAYLPDERVDRILAHHGLPERTSNTITDRGELDAELKRVRERGYAEADSERLTGLRCIAAPVTDQDGVAVGAVSVAGPTSRIKGDRYHEEMPERVRSAANVIELNMAYA